MTEENTEELDNEWMIRTCDVYKEEYRDCTSVRDRFQQYFVHGKTADCSQWNRDYNNCLKWVENKNIKAAKEVIESEIVRRKQRLGAHFGNKVWTRRNNPPEDWSKPLPEHMQEEYKNSYLDIKSREMKGEIEPHIDGSCNIM